MGILPLGQQFSGDSVASFRCEIQLSSSPWATSSLRRILDFGVGLLLLVLCSPLVLVIALAVQLSSPGPIIFRQRRAGRRGQEFTLLKFRSMFVHTGGSSITVHGDQRITRIGALLRRFKLDEFPQLWNVIRGEMSLVGPRPKLPQHEALYLLWRPGLTGPASLAFRDEERVFAGVPAEGLEDVYERMVKPAKARLDSEYMRNATFLSDLGILCRTASSCLSPWKDANSLSGEFLERPLLLQGSTLAVGHSTSAAIDNSSERRPARTERAPTLR